MSNYIQFKDKIAFHPGYYIKEYIDAVGLTQEDFAKRLGTTPKNISILIRGKQKISRDIANKLSRIIGTSVKYWLNLQSEFDALLSEYEDIEELEKEKEVLKKLDYSYFVKNFNLPSCPKQISKQIECLRKFLNVATLTVFKSEDMYVKFRSSSLKQSETNLIKANIMVQIGSNLSLQQTDIPKFDKKEFIKAVEYALTLTKNHDGFYELIKKAFYNVGVDLIILPNISGSKINGATKRIGNHIMLMVNDRYCNADSFWFTLFHEIGHIINGDFCVSLDNSNSEKEINANKFAEDSLVPSNEYTKFIKENNFTIDNIIGFAHKIDRDPSIVLGRLQNDKIIGYDDSSYNSLKKKLKILPNN